MKYMNGYQVILILITSLVFKFKHNALKFLKKCLLKGYCAEFEKKQHNIGVHAFKLLASTFV